MVCVRDVSVGTIEQCNFTREHMPYAILARIEHHLLVHFFLLDDKHCNLNFLKRHILLTETVSYIIINNFNGF